MYLTDSYASNRKAENIVVGSEKRPLQDTVTDLMSAFQASLVKVQKPAKNAQKAEMYAESERIRGIMKAV